MGCLTVVALDPALELGQHGLGIVKLGAVRRLTIWASVCKVCSRKASTTCSPTRRGPHRKSLAAGPPDGPGPLFGHGEIGEIRTQDLAPTLLDLLGVSVPSTYEGQSVATELVRPVRPAA
jgi:hypothetical protein